MISEKEKIELLKIEGKRLVQVYEAANIQEEMSASCSVCKEARRLMIGSDIESGCGICYQLGVGKRCSRFARLSDGFVGLACLLDPQYTRSEEIVIRKKVKDLILEVKDDLDEISNGEG